MLSLICFFVGLAILGGTEYWFAGLLLIICAFRMSGLGTRILDLEEELAKLTQKQDDR
ncbi:MAG: hypothetical protein UX47_C0004G0019 [Candidatus Collierbacteria bacterium GW2011_GWA2_46_26]|uniref:Uncharacterized protein n=1 Tax=Candidatus Collierbacteria bacterium GW2011_GWA2_46_26 TaxID=1618381 RepID=A0A0G1PKM9_9BACT|nr:MAG: hypothetical protein UX47_C0004G0019 [Candidatus Collierbacteria bacterium GW2011_GWA2_46_26]